MRVINYHMPDTLRSATRTAPPSHAEVELVRLQCVQQQEKDGDEMYCTAELSQGNGVSIGTERFPHEFGFWALKTGEEVQPKKLVYVGGFDGGLNIELSLMEMDMIKLSKGSVGIVGSWVDDFIGRFTIRISPTGSVEGTPGKHSELAVQPSLEIVGKDAVTQFQLRMTGNKAVYLLHLDVRIQ